MAFKKLSPLLPQPRAAPVRLGSVSSRSTPRTVISFTNFCPLLVINARTITGARSRIEPDFAGRSLRQFDPNGRKNCRYFCAFRRLAGSMVAGEQGRTCGRGSDKIRSSPCERDQPAARSLTVPTGWKRGRVRAPFRVDLAAGGADQSNCAGVGVGVGVTEADGSGEGDSPAVEKFEPMGLLLGKGLRIGTGMSWG
jgi:hypothetical protein